MVKRKGEVRAKVVDGANASTALPFLRENVDKNSAIITDDSRLKREYPMHSSTIRPKNTLGVSYIRTLLRAFEVR